MASMMFFKMHGEFCVTHPWEVIVTTFTVTACMVTTIRHCINCSHEIDNNAADMVVMNLISCLALLYGYYQLRILYRLGSKFILGIVALYTAFSCFVYTTILMTFLRIDIHGLKDALFFFLLLIDLSKATTLTQIALNSATHDEVKANIAKGIASLGPTVTLDTVVETLVIGVGTLSGVYRFEMLSYFACLSVIVNYLIFMTFYPSCLSLILELSGYAKTDNKKQIFMRSLKEQDQKSNPVVERVKLIMSLGLTLVHLHSRWPFKDDDEKITPILVDPHMTFNRTEDAILHAYILKWGTLSAYHIVILILILALTVKKITFFENKETKKSKSNVAAIETRQKIFNIAKPSPDEKMALYTPPSFFLGKADLSGTLKDLSMSKPVGTLEKEVQTEILDTNKPPSQELQKECKALEQCLKIYNDIDQGAGALTDEEIILLVQNKRIALYQIEKAVDDPLRGVGIRRQILSLEGKLANILADLPYKNYDYEKVMGACCENVIGYMPVPVGFAGPLHLDGEQLYIPMATTEGCLVASTNRGCRALIHCGVTSSVVGDGMTRGPVVRFPSLVRASEALRWMESPDNFKIMKEKFDSSSRFARLTRVQVKIAGRSLYIRFVATTGDAMGMNMLSKGTELCLKYVQEKNFPDMDILSISGNFCTDKKSAAVNWIEGRGKSVVCEAVVPAKVVSTILKTEVNALVDVNQSKNMIGSAMAGSIGGFNAHAGNIVTAVFIATGQDPAQNIGSSSCITLMEPWGEKGEDLYISCTMPSVEIGTIGGGTMLPAQSACLAMLGVKGAHLESPGENASKLARIVCGTVLAGELSLMAALTAGHLVKSHLRHNRSTTTVPNASLLQPPCKDT